MGYGGEMIGVVPSGLPKFSWPMFSFEAAIALLPGAFVLTLVRIMEARASSKTIAVESKQEIDANIELYGQGMANIIGSFFFIPYVISRSNYIYSTIKKTIC